MSEFNIMVPLELDLIDEGRFVGNINKALRNVQEQLVKHANTYGHKAAKAKASVKVEIALACLDPDQDAYGCAAQIKTALPAAPPAVTMLMAGESQTGEDCLLCKKSGSSKEHPKQLKLCTDDGRDIDPETGEIIAKEQAGS